MSDEEIIGHTLVQANMFETLVVGDPRDAWRTPKSLFDRLNAEFEFTFDLAADADNAKCDQFFTIEDNALAKDWTMLRGWVFLNPPFSQLSTWIEKTARTVAHGVGPGIVFLMPGTKNEQPHMHRWVWNCRYCGKPVEGAAWCATCGGKWCSFARQIRHIKGRTNYSPPPGIKRTTPEFGSQIIIFDPEPHRGLPTVRGMVV